MRFREERKKNNLSLSNVAEKLSVSKQTISNWENGVTEPDLKSLIKLSNLYHCSIDYLLENDRIYEYTLGQLVKKNLCEIDSNTIGEKILELVKYNKR